MKVAFVTPRYGPQVMGGAETAARQLAEHLVAETGWEAEAYSTCALDPHTWADELEPGDSDDQRGARCTASRRRTGGSPDFYGLDGRLRLAPQLASQGRGSPLGRLQRAGLARPHRGRVRGRMPTSSPSTPTCTTRRWRPSAACRCRPSSTRRRTTSPALYLPVFRGTFGDADAFCFHTAAERLLVEHTYPVAEKPQIVLGLGRGRVGRCGAPGRRDPRPRRPSLHRECRPGGRAQGVQDAGRVSSPPTRSATPARLALALVGPISVVLDPHPDIVITGVVDEADKWDIVRDAQVAVSPSALESFSLVVLEAWVDRVPVVVNGTCGPTREHCERSGGGLWFTSYPEFEAALDRLLADAGLAHHAGGSNGRAYVDRFYQWPVLIARYADFLGGVVGAWAGHAGASLRAEAHLLRVGCPARLPLRPSVTGSIGRRVRPIPAVGGDPARRGRPTDEPCRRGRRSVRPSPACSPRGATPGISWAPSPIWVIATAPTSPAHRISRGSCKRWRHRMAGRAGGAGLPGSGASPRRPGWRGRLRPRRGWAAPDPASGPRPSSSRPWRRSSRPSASCRPGCAPSRSAWPSRIARSTGRHGSSRRRNWGRWVEPVVAHIVATTPGGEVLHGDCGEGALLDALEQGRSRGAWC